MFNLCKYHVSCSSSNSGNIHQYANNKNNKSLLCIKLALTICSVLLLSSCNYVLYAEAAAAAVYSNLDFLSNPSFEPICHTQQEHFIESDGKESSLILEFNAGALSPKRKSCTRILSAPPSYGFIVRLILPKIRRGQHHNKLQTKVVAAATNNANDIKNAAAPTTLNEMTTLMEKLNATALKAAARLGRTCPLTIFSSLDPHTPQWRVDPCQLEDTAPEMEDPVILFHGRVRIVWEHGHNTLKSKLMVTVLGKGDQCRSEKKHQCLKIGDEPLLCISKDLVCDGIRHCPYSNAYDSDEDYTMCWKRRRFDEPIPPAMESDIFEHFALEVFRNLFAFDTHTLAAEDADTVEDSVTVAPPTDVTAVNTTTLRKVETKDMSNATDGESTKNPNNDTSTTESSPSGHRRHNSTRSGLHSDLSKYGPWGYLMLGMLLCGGALLICGLWASASQHAAQNEREAALQNGGNSMDHQSGSAAPPNYEELDPPPAYSVLFPNQKAGSSATLNSLAITPSTTAMASSTTNAVAIAAAVAVVVATTPSTRTNSSTPTTEMATTSGLHQSQVTN